MGTMECGMELEAMAVEMPEVAGHPNRVGFRGVLTLVDLPSDGAPHGANGRRVIVTRRAVEKAIPSLLGMGLDYAPAFDGHDAQRKVGVITRAEVTRNAVEVGGYLFGHDFPEVVEEIREAALKAGRDEGSAAAKPAKVSGLGKERGRWLLAVLQAGSRRLRARYSRGKGGPLGMSYEMTGVDIEDRRARTWVVRAMMFTGAAVLRREKAAYRGTWIELE